MTFLTNLFFWLPYHLKGHSAGFFRTHTETVPKIPQLAAAIILFVYLHVKFMGLTITLKVLTVIKCIPKHLEIISKTNYENLIFGETNFFSIKILDFEILSLDAIIGHQRVCHQSLDVPKKLFRCPIKHLRPRFYLSRCVKQVRMSQCRVWTYIREVIVTSVSGFEISAFKWFLGACRTENGF